MTRKSFIVTILFLVLFGLLSWIATDHAFTLVHIALADEQTEIFEDMVTKASVVLSTEQPDVAKAVDYLEYAHCYYPSGTKQEPGSRLDRIVERSRALSEKLIVDMLRKTAGKDLGDKPEIWIEEYRSKRAQD